MREIASSMRLFRRALSDGRGGTLEAAGVGEVCTSPTHRRRGLSRALMKDAIGAMEGIGVDVSLLHAAPELAGFYNEGGGYESVTSEWSVVTLGSFAGGGDDEGGLVVRLASFPGDTERLMDLHRLYSESRFAGCVVRTEDYWNDYVSKEIGDSLYVLVSEMMEGEGKIAGWLSIRPRGGRFQLRDFGVDRDMIGTSSAMRRLLMGALPKPEKEAVTELHLPTAILEEVQSECKEEGKASASSSFIDWDAGVKEENDVGWMYRAVRKTEGGGVKGAIEEGARHLIWPTDSF